MLTGPRQLLLAHSYKLIHDFLDKVVDEHFRLFHTGLQICCIGFGVLPLPIRLHPPLLTSLLFLVPALDLAAEFLSPFWLARLLSRYQRFRRIMGPMSVSPC